MKTTPVNQQQAHPLQMEKIQRLADWLAERLAERTAPETWSEVAILLVDDAGIALTNRDYFGKNRPTDVISFRYDPVPGEGETLSGDILVNVDRAVSEGAKRGDIDRELALYIAHGFDHLSGAEDDTPEKRKKMRATENAWLRAAKTQGLLDGLFVMRNS